MGKGLLGVDLVKFSWCNLMVFNSERKIQDFFKVKDPWGCQSATENIIAAWHWD